MRHILHLSTFLLAACAAIPTLHVSAPAASTAAEPEASEPALGEDAPSASPAPGDDGDNGEHDQLVQLVINADAVNVEIDSKQVGPDSGMGTYFEGQAQRCSDAVSKVLARGAKPSEIVTLRGGGLRIELGEADAKVCKGLAARVRDWNERFAAHIDAQLEAIEAPFRKVGVDGDKLDIVGRYHGGIKAPGQAEPTPEAVAHANALFTVGQRTDNHEWVLTRYSFRGNKLVGRTEQGFLVMPGPDAYR